MTYCMELKKWLIDYIDAGVIPYLKIWDIREKDLEKLVDYCYCKSTGRDYEQFTTETNVGYGVTTESEITKLIRRYIANV